MDLTEEQLVAVFKALGHPKRLQILEWLRHPDSFPAQDQPADEVGVCLKHITARAGVSQSTASEYMAILQRADLVTVRRIAQWAHYKRNEPVIAAAAAALSATD
ncbi:metalloregulator ArsR/SmtB family transcription factor [Curtobacterium sp. VKM Ac-2887]|uniref:ArsR/SmtB family transcription factor n=1 Tax=Curtobacterium sp. VKM Ac-2887 TaxID=2783819 RepID=UPI002B274D41|nr:metalloregulator ArsR/SmtB family transcription factor [Curtobacterium sp. VKM Ac-2887]